MKEKGGDNAKDDEKEEPGERPSSSVVSDYLPSMISSVSLFITLRYLPMSSISASVASSSSDPYPTEEEDTDYLYYATMFPVLMLSAFCMVTFLCNAIFGRRPDFDGRHNPVSHQIAENIGDASAPTLAILSTIIRVTSTTILGQRATAINRFINRGLVAVDVATRAATTADDLYDNAMDRCPIPNSGDMRRIEYGAMLTENFIVVTIESITHGIFTAMNMGMTRISLTSQNRLYVLAGIYRTADIVETFLITYTDDLAWFLEHVVDTPPIARILRSTGIADPEHPIHGVDPRNIPEKIQDGIEGIGEAIKDAAHNVEGGFEHFRKNVQKFFDDENKKEVDNQDDGGGKMSPEELDEYNQQHHSPTTFHGPYRFGRATMSNAETQTAQDTKETPGNITIGTSSSSEEEDEHNIFSNFFSNIFSQNQHRNEVNIENAPHTTLPMATLNQQQNGSYTMGIPLTIGSADINIPPELLNHITFNNMHFEVRRVPAGEEHHGRTGSYFLEHHRLLNEGVDSYRIPVNSETHTPAHTLIRLDGWEIRIYGVESPFSDGSSSNI